MSECWCSTFCCRMSVFVEKARKMGRTPLIAELDRYVRICMYVHTEVYFRKDMIVLVL